MNLNKLILILLIVLLIILYLITISNKVNNIKDKIENYYFVQPLNLNEEQCNEWLKQKNYSSKNVYNPLTDSYDIVKYSNNYYTIDDQCEKYEKIYTPFLNKEIPIYLQILYKLLDNVVITVSNISKRT